jgi:hypothetical protein
MKIRDRPRPASICSVFIEKICSTPTGDIFPGFGTGFLCRANNGGVWLVTCWHVLTGRRPDEPGFCVTNEYPWSPDRIRITFPMKQLSAFSMPIVYPLYENGSPKWREYKRSSGVDLAAIPIELPDDCAGITIQDFANGERTIEPGLDVVVVGFPFAHGIDVSYPIWKQGMVAYEPGYMFRGIPQIMIDMPGHPGMSGSPVYTRSSAIFVSKQQHDAFSNKQVDGAAALSLIDTIDAKQFQDSTVGLSFAGVYAGSTGKKEVERLNLGRMFGTGLVSALIENGELGCNPFPPDFAS